MLLDGRPRLHAWLTILGGLLLAPALLYWAWAWRFDPIRLGDSNAAFRNLAAIPFSRVTSQNPVELRPTALNDAQWRRIRRSWGNPDYLLAVISPGAHGSYLNCIEDLGLSVQVTLDDGAPVTTTNARCCPYGITTEPDASLKGLPKACKSIGLEFRIPAGAAFRVRVAANGNQLGPEAELAVSPHWTGEKDKMVGLDLDEDIRSFLRPAALVGLASLVLAALLRFRQRLASKARRSAGPAA